MEKDGYYLAVTEVNVQYKQSMQYGQSVRVKCWLEQLRSRTLTFGYEVLDAETNAVCVTGLTKHICITPDGRAAKLPDSWISAMRDD
jgi:acyl-CoA thioester hydrolase